MTPSIFGQVGFFLNGRNNTAFAGPFASPASLVGASLLAKNSRAPRSFWFHALSLTIFASKLAPTDGVVSPVKGARHARAHAVPLPAPPHRASDGHG
ncbi:hypothetical protein C1Y18_23630 [Pseudomonas sp. MPR-R5A]|nr:hypothetical protein C1Y25_31065 [Pseudomonas sp. MPBC4-3]PMX13258.1 hypothetical protein C1Y23_32215 [Pseudomonas sp. GW460-12]PMX32116.1 hypothetical protein C1Y24_22360 [Pseudomonas sp. MPR-R2A4]PMX38536.1 hypothetical protein C1Y26_22365 [Pseudomonas sp. MPR-R2A7]PMX42568.1 hypothetical protein C1Y20_28580 [Pseudomonas sp. FW301-21B01]PMX51437.1 hypothetical protein C1Y17_24170 [Pseudomonas sp. MPR-R2A6]PMX92215.1 hypothetical protein C1Y21_08155 [Pseudomonas sp. MPR-R2A3]PMY04178.1 h